jgi:predicted ATPase with chaperone activity
MLAKRLPAFSHDLAEALETTKIHSVAGKLKEVVESKTLRSPHHTIFECCISREVVTRNLEKYRWLIMACYF